MQRVSPVAGAAALTALLGLMALGLAPRPPDDGGDAPAVHPPEDAPDPDAGSTAAAALLEGEPMDLNQAAPQDLMLLPRIGPTLAERIQQDRADHGPYRRLDELRRVSGVGEATVDGLRSLACAGQDCPASGSEVENPAEPYRGGEIHRVQGRIPKGQRQDEGP